MSDPIMRRREVLSRQDMIILRSLPLPGEFMSASALGRQISGAWPDMPGKMTRKEVLEGVGRLEKRGLVETIWPEGSEKMVRMVKDGRDALALELRFPVSREQDA